jgi:adenylate cyclase, class 2
MANEIEAKARVERLDAVRSKLGELGGRLADAGFERNVVFDTPDGKLRAKDSLLRLRRYNKAILTFKGPRLAAGAAVKSRAEIEFEVSDFDAAAELLESLGFERVWVYEKRREKWTLEGAKVFLDVLPHIGEFIEVEGSDEDEVLSTLEKLGVSKRAVTPKTYLELFDEYSRRSGKRMTDMVFEEGEGR